jgi:hypothetical protein
MYPKIINGPGGVSVIQEEMERAIILATINTLPEESREILFKQFKSAEVVKREFTGVGFYTDYKISREAEPVSGLENPLSGLEKDVFINFEGLDVPAMCFVWMEGGYIECLECKTFTENWPEQIKDFQIILKDRPSDAQTH